MGDLEPVGASGTPTPGNGAADPVEGSATPVAPEQTAGEGAASTDGARRDFLAEMRENPEKAAEMVQRFQRDKDKADAELRSFKEKAGDLLPYIEAGASERLATFLENYGTLRSHPTYAQAVKALESSGQLPTQLQTQSDDEDEYEDPSIRSLRQELAARDERIRALEQKFGQSEASRGMEQFKQHVKTIYEEWPDLTEDDKQAISQGVEGDLKTMNGETVAKFGRDAVRVLMLKHLDDSRLMEAAKRRVLREQQQREAASTGVPSNVVSPGTEPRKDRPTALEAFREGMELARTGRL